MKRRGLVMLLAGVMVISTVGSSAFGAEIGTEEMMESYVEEVTVPENVDADKYSNTVERVDSGDSAGYELNYAVNEDGTATLTGYQGDLGETLIIPEKIDSYTVTAIGEWAFDRTKIENISVSQNVEKIEENAFACCSQLKSITVDVANEKYCSVDGVLYTKDKKNLMLYPCKKTATIFTVPDTVMTICTRAFEGCTNLEKIEIPSCVNEIEMAAFEGCSNLTQIELPQGLSVISACLFQDCYSLTHITIPTNVTVIGESAFSGCTVLQSIELPDGLERFGRFAFEGSALEEINIPKSVTGIADYAFFNCSKLRKVTIPNSVTGFGSAAFSMCSALEEIKIPESVTYIGSGAFNECSSLKEIVLPAGLTSLGGGSLAGCTGIERMVIPGGLTEISRLTFDECMNLKEVIIANNVETIGYWAFLNCTSLQTIVLPASVGCVEFSSFKGCTALESALVLNDNVYYEGSESYPMFEKDTTLYGTPGSTTETFAQTFGLTFRDASEYLSAPVLSPLTTDSTGVTISWEPLTRAQGYFIYRKSGNGDWQQIAQVEGSSESSYVDNTATAGATYTYTVKAYTAQGDFVGPCDETGKKVSILKPATGNITATIIGGNVDAATTMVTAQNPVDIKTVVNNSDISNAGYTLDGSVLYDIYFQKNGKKVQPGTDVQVSIPVPTGMNGEKCSVLYIDGNGNFTDMNAVYADGYMVFTTNHFSYYAVVEEYAGLLGDVSGDGKVNSRDLNRLYAHVNGTNELIGEAFALGDVTGDGKINTRDLNRLYAHVNGTNPLW